MTWAWAVLAVALLVGSGGLRLWQRLRIDRTLTADSRVPFPLATLPTQVGPWQGRDDQLDPETARTTGATDHVFRTYVNAQTGVHLSVIVLYGPGPEVSMHSPENCYPLAGFGLIDGPRTRPVRIDGGIDVPFRALTYARGEVGGPVERQFVFYAWGYNGSWSPVKPMQKQLERMPRFFKVHIARDVGATERFDLTGAGLDGKAEGLRDPCQDFLDLFLPELDRRLNANPNPNANLNPGAGRVASPSMPPAQAR
jgi:EpsI family protein